MCRQELLHGPVRIRVVDALAGVPAWVEEARRPVREARLLDGPGTIWGLDRPGAVGRLRHDGGDGRVLDAEADGQKDIRCDPRLRQRQRLYRPKCRAHRLW